MLESGLQNDNSFVTLTYEKNPVSLEPLDLRAFLDRLRKLILPTRIRYYAVGEYGDQNWRPHYHLALFNYPTCSRLRSKRGACCPACDTIRQAWHRGFIINLPLELGSAKYIAKYTVKKMTRFDDPRLGNRHPEFSRMSNQNGGIGFGALDATVATIRKYNLLTPQGDVPVTLRHGSTEMPLGRYLRQQIRKKMGLDHRSPHILTAEAAYAHSQSEEGQALRDLQKAAIANKTGLKTQVLNQSAVKRAQITSRHNMRFTKGKL